MSADISVESRLVPYIRESKLSRCPCRRSQRKVAHPLLCLNAQRGQLQCRGSGARFEEQNVLLDRRRLYLHRADHPVRCEIGPARFLALAKGGGLQRLKRPDGKWNDPRKPIILQLCLETFHQHGRACCRVVLGVVNGRNHGQTRGTRLAIGTSCATCKRIS